MLSSFAPGPAGPARLVHGFHGVAAGHGPDRRAAGRGGRPRARQLPRRRLVIIDYRLHEAARQMQADV